MCEIQLGMPKNNCCRCRHSLTDESNVDDHSTEIKESTLVFWHISRVVSGSRTRVAAAKKKQLRKCFSVLNWNVYRKLRKLKLTWSVRNTEKENCINIKRNFLVSATAAAAAACQARIQSSSPTQLLTLLSSTSSFQQSPLTKTRNNKHAWSLSEEIFLC